MQPQPRKGQTSLDFLMTYGWAVLLVVVVVASLFALGVFNAGSFLGPRATGFSQLDVVAWNIDSGGSLSLKLQNLAGMDVRVARIDASYGTSNYSFPITNVSIPNSKTSEVFTVGTISGLVPGQYYTLPMKITYMDFNGFNYTETGTISGNVGVGAPAPSLRINSPHSDDLLSNWTVNVSFTVAGANLSQADISIINSSGVIDSDSRSSPGTYTVQLSVSSDGVYDIAAIAYYNDGSNITAASTNITVNTTAPPPSGLQCGDPLDQEGHTYVLEDDVGSSGTCFAIGADNVTLDCDGHTITYAQAETGYGINITSHSNAIVRDCNIVQGNSSNNDSFGVYLFGGSIGNNIFDNNITTYGLDGVPIRLLSGCSNNYFGENILHSTQSHGIQFQSADYNTAWNNMIYVDGPSGNGIISMYSTGNNLTGNSIVTVGDNVIGISLSHESGDIVSGNTVSTNGSDSRGVYLEGSSESNTVISNNIITTSGAGTYLTGSTDNNFVSNNISSTSGPGVFFYGAADGNNFTSNIISSTNYFGAEISSTGGITFVNNSISSTNSIGVRMAYDGGINFTNNNISSTNSYGVQLISSSGSLFYDNIINGTTSVSSDGSSNSWNTALDCGTSNIVGGPCIGGNFWAQPDGNGWSQNASECNANSSGICTSNYTIDSNNVDELPLAPPISLFSCGNISYSGNYVLTSDVSDDGTCFTIEADYVTLDCAGHTVEYARGSAGYGVDITGYNFTTVKNCNIMQTNSSVASAHAVFLAGAMNSTIQDNSISTGGDGAFGVYLYWRSGSANNSFINNTIATTGAGSTGVFLQENEDGNLLSGNIISANGSNSAGISISACQNDTLTGNDITATGAGISLSGSSNSTVSDNTITSIGSYGVSLSSSSSSLFYDNIINGTTPVSSDGSPNLWNTALSCDVPGVANIVGGPCVGGNFWAQPDGNGWSENATECNANSSGICSSPYVIDGSNTDELPLAPLTPLFGCGNVSYSGYYVLTGDVSDDGTCFTIAADNVTLDCLGHMINYSQTTRGFGVNVTGRINATIRNCNIVQGSASFNASAVSLIGAGYSRITNNAITTIGNWSTAISVNSNNTFISYNTITIYGSNSSNGINMFTNAKNNTIESNNITMRGTFTSTAYAGRPVGINSGGPPTSFTALAMNTVRNNTVTLASTAMRNRGISVGNSANVTVANNTVVSYANDSAGINVGGIGHTVTGNSITIAADANFSYGINIGSANSSLFLANGITVSSTNSNGIAMGGNSTYNNISGNNITTTNDIATAVSLFSSSSNNTFSDNTIFTNGSNLEGISLYDSCNYNTFSDNTISTNVSNAGGISLYNNCNYNTLISNNITTGGNDAYGLFLGSSSNNNTFASNRITSSSSASIGLISSSGNLFYNNLFNGTTQADSTPNLWNTTLDCGTANIIGGACTGGNFWANSSDTGFSQTCSDTDVNGICDSIYDILGDGSNFDNLPLAAPPPPLSCGSAIYSNTTLASDITGCTGNGLYIGANDVTLDCAGHNITYGTASGWVNGINIGNYNHTTIRNCNIVQGGPNTNTNDNGIFLSSSTGNIIYNNTITVIGNGSNGISIWIYSSNSTIADNAVTATGNGSNAIAMWNSTNIAVINNTVITTGNSDSAIGMMWNSTNAIISNNTIATFGLSSPGINMPNGANLSAFGNNVTTIGASSHGIVVLSSPDNNITSNNISVSGTNSFGIFDYMGSNNTRILDNRINTTGFTGLGILVHSSSNATVWNNTVSTTNNGSSAISFSNATGGLASYNTVDTYGANSSHGIAMGIAINSATTPSRNVTVEWNTVTVHGDSSPSDVTNPVACIMAAGADYNTIQNNNLTAAGAKDSGIQASYHSSFPTSTSANNITITDNTITLTGTNATGFRFMVGTNHTVTGNTVIAAGSLSNGLLLNKTNSSTFDSNKINAAGSGYGIRATSSSGNLIYNNIINGTASSDTNVNTWNVTLSCSGPQNIIGGSCIGGNYWANATGDGWSETCTDTTPADGVCDTGNEYLIPNSNDYDYLPLH